MAVPLSDFKHPRPATVINVDFLIVGPFCPRYQCHPLQLVAQVPGQGLAGLQSLLVAIAIKTTARHRVGGQPRRLLKAVIAVLRQPHLTGIARAVAGDVLQPGQIASGIVGIDLAVIAQALGAAPG